MAGMAVYHKAFSVMESFVMQLASLISQQTRDMPGLHTISGPMLTTLGIENLVLAERNRVSRWQAVVKTYYQTSTVAQSFGFTGWSWSGWDLHNSALNSTSPATAILSLLATSNICNKVCVHFVKDCLRLSLNFGAQGLATLLDVIV